MRRHPAALISAAALLALAGCTTTPERVVVPEIVTVPVKEYVPVPEALTRECPAAELKDRTVEAVVEASNARKVCLDQVNGQLRKIKGLGSP
ncbi:MAG TPA: hypothetical protein VIG97_03425 [Luteimonas sp.]